MNIQFYKKTGEKDAIVSYPKSLESEISDSRILEYIHYIQNQNRVAIANTKTRSEVSGGGKKPWKQKGTGRARHGSRRSPIWIGGGITFGPRSDRNFATRMNKKVRRAALLSIIFSKVKEKSVIGITDLEFGGPKTADAANVIEKLPVKGFTALFAESGNENLVKSFRNIAVVKLINPARVNINKILTSDTLIFTRKSLKELESVFSGNKSKEVKPVLKENADKDE